MPAPARMARAEQTCVALAGLMGLKPEQVLPFSTGVIMETLPVDRITAGLPAASPRCVTTLGARLPPAS